MYQSQAMNTLKDVNVDFFISKNPHAWKWKEPQNLNLDY